MPKIITVAKTKELLGIQEGSQDELINRYIPIIDAKVKLITKNRYNVQVLGDTTADSTTVKLKSIRNNTLGQLDFFGNPRWYDCCKLGINNPWCIEDLEEYIDTGTLISGGSIPANTYIDEVFYNGFSVVQGSDTFAIPTVTLSAAATETATGVQMFLGFNIGLQTTVAKGIAWLIDQENETEPDLGWTSSRIGSIGVVRGVSQAAIDGRYGMPVWFVNAFPKYMSGH
jgi:hypothetical protein